MTDRRGNASVEDGAEPGQAPADVETERSRTGEGAGDVELGPGQVGERPLAPGQAGERANALDESTAGDGVQFFEGDPGPDDDVERSR